MLLLGPPLETVRPTTLLCLGPCGEWKPDEAFAKNKDRPNRRGRYTRCRECQRAWRQEPGTCIECGEPTASRETQRCGVHQPQPKEQVKPTTLRCCTCKKFKPDEAFHRAKTYPERRGRHVQCRECHQAWYRQPGRCVTCGEPTPSREARFCITHYSHGGRRWTRERIIEEIQGWEHEHGSPPRVSDWQTAGRWPSTQTVFAHFDSWNAAIEAAGLEPRPRHGLPRPFGATCKHGHPWIPENVYVRPNGIRSCRTCHREEMRERRAKEPRNPRPPWQHGTIGGYGNHRCRCDLCVEAWNTYCRERRRLNRDRINAQARERRWRQRETLA